jgi:hypothetical protein
MNEERWLPVCPGYEVSDHGRVRSLDRVVESADSRRRKVRGCVLRPAVAENGYLMVTFAGKTTSVHRLVALAFLGPPPNGTGDVNHKDCVKSNNRLSNLEWCSRSENMLHAYRNGVPHAVGEANKRAKLNADLVRGIRSRCAAGEAQSTLVRELGISAAVVSNVVRRKAWSHVT